MAWPPYIDDDGSGTVGTITDKAFFDAMKGYVDGLAGADWQVLPITAAAFHGNVGTWTVTGFTAYHCWFNAPTGIMLLTVAITASTVSGNPQALQLTLPGGLFPAVATVGTAYVSPAGVWEIDAVVANPSDPNINIQRAGFAAFAAGNLTGTYSIVLAMNS